MAEFTTQCPHCKMIFSVKDELEGRTFQCPHCCKDFAIFRLQENKAVFCVHCGTKMDATAKFCAKCGTPAGKESSFNAGLEKTVQAAANGMGKAVSVLTGLDASQDFSIKNFLSAVFHSHNKADFQEAFCRGYQTTTPELEQVDLGWPKPWLYSRILFFSALTFIALLILNKIHPNLLLIPNILFIGPFGFQIAMLFFFYEMNILKNISLPRLFIAFFLVGILSLLLTSYFSETNSTTHFFAVKGVIWAGPIEELAKLLAVVWVFSKYKENYYILNGILYGAAVGAGFSAFESTGYAFTTLMLPEQTLEYALHASTILIILRTVSQFFSGHAIWTAMCCGALWKIKGDQEFKMPMLWDWRFLRVALVAIGSHMLNNSLFLIDSSSEKSIYTTVLIRGFIVGIVDWLVVIALLKTGINQVAEKKKHLCTVPQEKYSENNENQ